MQAGSAGPRWLRRLVQPDRGAQGQISNWHGSFWDLTSGQPLD